MIGGDLYVCARCDVDENRVEIVSCVCNEVFCLACVDAHMIVCPEVRQ